MPAPISTASISTSMAAVRSHSHDASGAAVQYETAHRKSPGSNCWPKLRLLRRACPRRWAMLREAPVKALKLRRPMKRWPAPQSRIRRRESKRPSRTKPRYEQAHLRALAILVPPRIEYLSVSSLHRARGGRLSDLETPTEKPHCSPSMKLRGKCEWRSTCPSRRTASNFLRSPRVPSVEGWLDGHVAS